MSSSKVIQKEKLTAYQRWELPTVGDGELGESASKSQVIEKEPEPQFPTVEEIQKIQQQAYDEAYKDGLAAGKIEGKKIGVEEGRTEGRLAGIEKGQHEIREIGNKLNELFSHFTQPLAALDDEIEQELVSLVVAMTKNLVRREVKTDPGQIVAALRQGVAALPSAARNVRVYLHPEDAILVKEAMAIVHEAEESRWRIVEDAALTRGGCNIESDESRIDATVEARLMQVISQVLGGEREGER
ncbi:MAG: flagellar assembly protein FliH [Gammaproteobacteria bacterium]|nr:flagellar assembly protein FliH [Gammaproteobacteria bacterium]